MLRAKAYVDEYNPRHEAPDRDPHGQPQHVTDTELVSVGHATDRTTLHLEIAMESNRM
jgi:hypothetical protein